MFICVILHFANPPSPPKIIGTPPHYPLKVLHIALGKGKKESMQQMRLEKMMICGL